MDIAMNTLERLLVPTSGVILALTLLACSVTPSNARKTELITSGWQFHLGDVADGQNPALDDSGWRTLNLPHDWSIEGKFSKDNPATAGGGALPGGIGWYRKSFTIPEADSNKLVFIDFDGVYRKSEVWINGQYLGKRPYGYSSFRYELTPYLNHGARKNIIAVKVDNSQQPNSRWYSGSGIYRNVRLVTTGNVYVDHWGTFVTTSEVTSASAKASIAVTVRNRSARNQPIVLRTVVLDAAGRNVAQTESQFMLAKDSLSTLSQTLTIASPALWTIEAPTMYKAVTTVECNGAMSDDYETPFGIRTFAFDRDKGFSLNGKPMKIKGVCNHHDLGCLGSAVNKRALERQMEIMKAMGVNGIRTSHNPPAPELLELCDRMGFIVLDEAFDMWKNKKTDYDYAGDWDEWHVRDLQDLIRRDRNHPSVIIWSIGNEVTEQWRKDSVGAVIARELAAIVRALDTTRPITSACNNAEPGNPVITSGALDLTGLNYHHETFPNFPTAFPRKTFLGTETTSAIATRGQYDNASDSVRIWPIRWDIPFKEGNADLTCSAYDNCRVPWGSTHEDSWKVIKKYDFLCGMFIWTGFDYLGEPTPYDYPARSSYFGIVDLAGFPKDSYYMYQSEWTDQPVLHLFPHWNWKQGDTVDVWVYSSCAQVELFLNGQSLGSKQKASDDLHLVWRVPFVPGTLKAVGRNGKEEPFATEVRTAGAPAKIVLEADRKVITADGTDLSFVTVKVVDEHGTVVPNADNLIRFTISGNGTIAGVDNGLQTSAEPFKADYRKTFNGMCLAVIQSTGTAGTITLTARSSGLADAVVEISAR
jgi:beta-galactosidase